MPAAQVPRAPALARAGRVGSMANFDGALYVGRSLDRPTRPATDRGSYIECVHGKTDHGRPVCHTPPHAPADVFHVEDSDVWEN
eukprot:4002144-Prymnesium_polylepis.2